MIRRNLLSLALLVLALCSANAIAANELESTDSDKITLQSWREKLVEAESIRVKIVRDAAMSAAMRAGLAKHSLVINRLLSLNAKYLDDIYDFNGLMLEHNVVPPVIRRVERVTEQEGDVLRYSAVRFRILKQAKFATKAPSWRQYLMVPIWDDLGRTHANLMPRNSAEREAARQGLESGWEAGKKQANDMFYKGLVRLDNDYLGMATYHALLKSNMVTLPKILRSDVPIVGDGSSMTLDQSTYRIETRPVFNAQMMSWVALIDGGNGFSVFKDSVSENERDKMNMSAPSYEDLTKAWLN